MRTRRIALVAAVIIAVLLLVIMMPARNDIPSDMFVFEGVYYERQGIVEISFEDTSEGTQSAILEIQGMAESFQRTYQAAEFSETVDFGGAPEFGWKVHPITLSVEHDLYGMIHLKTEIRPSGEAAPPIIVGVR